MNVYVIDESYSFPIYKWWITIRDNVLYMEHKPTGLSFI